MLRILNKFLLISGANNFLLSGGFPTDIFVEIQKLFIILHPFVHETEETIRGCIIDQGFARMNGMDKIVRNLYRLKSFENKFIIMQGLNPMQRASVHKFGEKYDLCIDSVVPGHLNGILRKSQFNAEYDCDYDDPHSPLSRYMTPLEVFYACKECMNGGVDDCGTRMYACKKCHDTGTSKGAKTRDLKIYF